MTIRPPAQHIRYVSCTDPFARNRRARVLRDDARVVLISPPGEVALFTVAQAREMANAITTAIRTITGLDEARKSLDVGTVWLAEPGEAKESTAGPGTT